jgi:hypothetical protein
LRSLVVSRREAAAQSIDVADVQAAGEASPPRYLLTSPANPAPGLRAGLFGFLLYRRPLEEWKGEK